MDSQIISAVYCIIITLLVVIFILQRKHQKKMDNKKHVKISDSISGIDLKQLKENYRVLNNLLDNIKDENEKVN